MTLHAASDLLVWAEATGVVEIKEDYSIVSNPSALNNDALLRSKLEDTKEEVEAAVTYLEVAAASSGTDVSEVVDGFNSLIAELNTEIAAL
jgi:hypothetical protein